MKNNEENKKQNNTKKIIKNAFIFVFLIILTYYFIFKKIDRKGLQEAIKNTNYLFIGIAVIFAAGNILFEALNIYRSLKLLKEDATPMKAIKYAIVGFFFSAITPAATGGQPVQLYYMHKDNIRYIEIPFEEEVYIKYIGEIASCKITLNGYTQSFVDSLNHLKDMVYPRESVQSSRRRNKRDKKSKNSGKNSNGQAVNANNSFDPNINNTLNMMKKNNNQF
jgi:hypothetical protein